jgi:hypothetical protein
LETGFSRASISIETQVPTLNARHGSNYFGLKKGLSTYTLAADHVLAF